MPQPAKPAAAKPAAPKPAPPKITKADLAAKTHKPHGGSKDSNTAMLGKGDDKKLRKLNAEIAAAEKKRDALAAASAAAAKKAPKKSK